MFIGLTTATFADVEYGFMKALDSATLLEGEVLTVLSVIKPSSAGPLVRLKFPPYDESYETLSITSTSTTEQRIIPGPCRVSSYGNGHFAYKITRHEVTANPMNIVALPADNNGDVELLIETSMDLITWTPVYSGSAGTSNSAAFFRTRLIKQ
jgi:hypothetical protein